MKTKPTNPWKIAIYTLVLVALTSQFYSFSYDRGVTACRAQSKKFARNIQLMKQDTEKRRMIKEFGQSITKVALSRGVNWLNNF